MRKAQLPRLALACLPALCWAMLQRSCGCCRKRRWQLSAGAKHGACRYPLARGVPFSPPPPNTCVLETAHSHSRPARSARSWLRWRQLTMLWQPEGALRWPPHTSVCDASYAWMRIAIELFSPAATPQPARRACRSSPRRFVLSAAHHSRTASPSAFRQKPRTSDEMCSRLVADRGRLRAPRTSVGFRTRKVLCTSSRGD